MRTTRHLVLDNEAVQVLLSTRTRDRKRAQVLEAIVAAAGGIVEVLTSDVGDLQALASYSPANIDVVRL